MATINTILGPMRGRIGSMVFRQNKGQQIAQQHQPIVANPRSALQQTNRARFVALMAFGRLLRPLIAIGFKEYAGRLSWLQKFMSTNTSSNLFEWDEPSTSWLPNPENLVIAEGSLHQNAFDVDNVTALGFRLTWVNTPVANQSNTDKLSYLVSKDGVEPLMFRFNGGAPVDRSAGTTTIAYPLVDGDVVTIVAFFVRSDGTVVSNSYPIVLTVDI